MIRRLPECLLRLLPGVLLLAACSDHTPRRDVQELVAQISETQLRRHVAALADAGPRPAEDRRATRRVADYIRTRLLDFGYRPFEEGPATAQPDDADAFVNILATRSGRASGAGILEVAAHYDTVADSPGADDNASGVAAVLEIARVLSKAEVQPTIRFCFFAREETGRDGSRYHVEQIRRRNEPLDGAIVLEMVGYTSGETDTQRTPARIPLLFSPPTTGNFVAVVGNLWSGGLGNRFERARAIYAPALPLFSANRVGGFFRDALRSDHKPYWDQGYHAIMLTDTANFRNPHYHRPTDTADTLDFRFLRHITQATAATLLTAGR